MALFDEQENLKYFSKPGIFQQINTESNHQLRLLLKEKIKERKVKKVIDLYCGSGNLSLELSKSVEQILGVEGSKEAIAVAQKNIEKNQISNAQYIAEDASKFLKNKVDELKKYDALILDPPRRGAKEDLASILKISPKYIFYISCNPTTAARDYSLLKEKYRLEEIFAFNFFPSYLPY